MLLLIDVSLMARLSLDSSLLSVFELLILSVPLMRFEMKGLQNKVVLKFILSLVLLLGTPAQGHSGIEFLLSQDGLNSFANPVISSSFEEIVENLPIFKEYDLSSKNLKIALWNIKLTDAIIPTPTVTPIPEENILKVAVNGTSLKMQCKWWYQRMDIPDAMDSGTFSWSVSGLNVSLSARIRQDKGKPFVKFDSCHASVGKYASDFGEETKGYYADQDLEEKFKKDFESATCDALTDAMDEVTNKKLKSLNFLATFGPLTLDFSLTDDVIVGSNYVKAFLKGQFLGDYADMNLIPMDLPMDRMVALGISEEVLNSALRTWHHADWTEISFVKYLLKDIAATIPLSWIKLDKPLLFQVNVPNPPTASISPAGIFSNISGFVEISLNNSESGSNYSSSLSISFSCNVKTDMYVKDSKKIVFAVDHFSLILSSPENPGLDLTKTNKAIASYLKMHANHMRRMMKFELSLPQSFPLKVDRLTFKNKYFILSADIAHFYLR